MRLTIGEEVNESVWVFFEDGFTAREKASVSDGVVIKCLGLLFDESEGEF